VDHIQASRRSLKTPHPLHEDVTPPPEHGHGTVIGLDDTDSRERGMCTTYVATRVARALGRDGASVDRLQLVRLNPAVKYKTRGNAALAIHTDADPDRAMATARSVVGELAEVADDRTAPGVVVGTGIPPESVVTFARDALRSIHDIDTATALIDEAGYRSAGWKSGRGRIGALAAVGAAEAFDEWTYEYIAYREPDRWGSPRDVDEASVFAAADRYYPRAWDTVDRGEGEPVCVPNAPGPILYGIRGDDPNAVAGVAAEIEAEPVHTQALFETNQGTDAHLAPADLGDVEPDRGYVVEGEVVENPETRRGGHVFLTLAADGTSLQCAAFEPTKRFRDRVRSLRVGDRVTVAGEVADGTLKLEKFAVRDLVTTEAVTPTCPDCGNRMESAGADQGYRCRDCGTTADTKATVSIDRELEAGWYEVPPCARRHVAKPLVRGGFDAPVHPER
jgi:tRNA(Ile2)-agmatinylcytidine synthase